MLFQIASAKEWGNRTSISLPKWQDIHNTECRRYFISNFFMYGHPNYVLIYCDSQKIKLWSSLHLCFANYQIWYFVCCDNSSIIIENHEFSFLNMMWSFSPWVNEHKGLVIVVLSAYKMNLRLALISWIPFLYIMNSRGPNIEPWGSHVSVSQVEDAMPSYSIYRMRCVR